jgi:hypothetical protein
VNGNKPPSELACFAPGGMALGAFLERRRPAKRSIATHSDLLNQKQIRNSEKAFQAASPNLVLGKIPHPIKDR